MHIRRVTNTIDMKRMYLKAHEIFAIQNLMNKRTQTGDNSQQIRPENSVAERDK